jgi:tetratricopeptide (TPR) repeat protein
VVLEAESGVEPVPPVSEVLKALQKNPVERFGTAQELADDLRRFLLDQPIKARPPSLRQRAAKWARRHRSVVVAVTLTLLAALVALAISTILIWQERGRADEAYRAEAAQRGRAEKRLRQACQAVDEMLTRVGGESLNGIPRMEQVRRALLEKALEFYQAFLQEGASDPVLRHETAKAYLRVGQIQEWLGRPPEAETAYRQSIGLLEALSNEFPGDSQCRQDLARSYFHFAALKIEIGARAQAGEVLQRLLQARDIQQELADLRPDEPPVRLDLAGTFFSLGRAYCSGYGNMQSKLDYLEQNHKAEDAYRQAARLLVKLIDESPRAFDPRRLLGEVFDNLGDHLLGLKRYEEAEVIYRRNIDHRQELVNDFPLEPVARFHLAHAHGNLGFLFEKTSRPGEAEQEWGLVIDVSKSLVAEFPTVPEYQRWLALGYNERGIVLAQTGQLQAAEEAHRHALPILSKLASEFPAWFLYRVSLGYSHVDLGDTLRKSGRPMDAEASYRQALAVHRALAADLPKEPACAYALARTLLHLATLQNETHQHAEARRLLEEARPYHRLALQWKPDSPRYRDAFRSNRQAMCDALLGLLDHAAAAAEAEEIARLGYDPAGHASNAACCLSRCAPLAATDANLPEAQRHELARRYADRAMALLGQAVQTGWKDVAVLKNDTALDPLRARQDFQELLAGLEQKQRATSATRKP